MPSLPPRRAVCRFSLTGLFALQVALTPPALAAGPLGSPGAPGSDPARPAIANPLSAEIDRRAAAVDARMIEWRRHFHQHPELGNRETRTAAYWQ